MSVDPTKEILSDEQIDMMVAGLCYTLLTGVFEQLGSPLAVIAKIFGDMKEENILAASKKLAAVMKEWSEKADYTVLTVWATGRPENGDQALNAVIEK